MLGFWRSKLLDIVRYWYCQYIDVLSFTLASKTQNLWPLGRGPKFGPFLFQGVGICRHALLEHLSSMFKTNSNNSARNDPRCLLQSGDHSGKIGDCVQCLEKQKKVCQRSVSTLQALYPGWYAFKNHSKWFKSWKSAGLWTVAHDTHVSAVLFKLFLCLEKPPSLKIENQFSDPINCFQAFQCSITWWAGENLQRWMKVKGQMWCKGVTLRLTTQQQNGYHQAWTQHSNTFGCNVFVDCLGFICQ